MFSIKRKKEGHPYYMDVVWIKVRVDNVRKGYLFPMFQKGFNSGRLCKTMGRWTNEGGGIHLNIAMLLKGLSEIDTINLECFNPFLSIQHSEIYFFSVLENKEKRTKS